MRKLASLGVAAVGVVYGDIGTSPLYTLKECFASDHGMAPTPANVLGVVSLIFWAIVVVVSLKYVLFVMCADNRGEGGILALVALLAKGRRRSVVVLGLLGAALFTGDGLITPAISVLSAVEGVTVAAPAMAQWVVPVTLAVLGVLFALQRHGTARIGALFGPVMLVWFAVLTALGAAAIVAQPAVLAALDPRWGIAFLTANGWHAFWVLGAVMLAITGGEALYADMGHFGSKPIRVAWFACVLPALVTNYFGQAALLLADPAAVRNPFYLLAPDWALVPLIALATLATVIASQAVITGVFSLLRQASQLGFTPRLAIHHTSAEEEGQIYIAPANWALLVGVVVLVLAFRESSNLAAAYGIAVTGTMAITTVLALVVARTLWKWNRWLCLAVGVVLLAIDAVFLGANLMKVGDGGWVPLAVGAAVFVAMQTWKRGRTLLRQRRQRHAVPLARFLADRTSAGAARVAGTAVYLTGNPELVPEALLHNLRHNRVLHRRVVLLTVETAAVPRVEDGRRIALTDLGAGFHRLVARTGYMQDPDIPEILALARARGLEVDPATVSYFVGRQRVVAALGGVLPPWRRRVFAIMHRLGASATEVFRLPAARVVELGTRVSL
ncbi:MAG: potassium transporter Kup [Magnetospirillum sp.]|nr:potassium transporter Kup [Magnetospirillum sp.]